MNGNNKQINSAQPVVTPSLNYDKDKKWQNELLMERLKSKAAQHRSFQEMSKAMRMALLEKRYALDHVEKANLQKCLDSMQHCIKVTSRQGLVERLESLTRQLGLKFMEDPSGLFISSDMFYLEIVLDSSGTVQDVKVHHEGNIEQQSCKELVNCLVKGDFVDFTQQLEGLASIYQLNAEQKIKTKAFVALQALETDLTNIYMFQNIYKEPQVLLYKSAVGILQPRRGGHPMKLTFFISPYDLLDFENKTLSPIDVLNTKNIGMSVTVNLEASGANKLQIQPILMVNKDQQGRSTPVSAPLSPLNSTMFPASFVLRLSKPMPMSYSFVQQIKQTTDLDFGDSTALSPMLSLIVNHESDGEINSIGKGLFVSLPEQNHCYFVTNTKNLDGIVIKSVPFTEPGHVPHILNFLRLQAAFNALISSCIRLKGRQDIENAIMFEISAISCHLIVVSLEHPYEESMATVEINLSDLTNILCKIYSLTRNYDHIAMKLSKVIQNCMSIPIAMRALIKHWDKENQLKVLNGTNFNLSHGPSDPGGRNNVNSNAGGGGGGGCSGGVGSGGGGISTGNLNVTGIGNGNNDFGREMIKSMSGGTNAISKNGSNASNIANANPANRSMFQQNPNFNEHNLNNLFSNDSASSANNQDPLSFNNDLSSTSKASKKRRTNLMNEDFWKNPKSNTNHSNETSELLECSNNSSDSNSLGTSSVSVLSETGVATPNSNPGFNNNSSDIDQPSSDNRTMSDDCDLSDSELMHKKVINKVPSVSITPISTNLQSVLTGMNLELRTGIEILPFNTSTATQNLPSSITITPINSNLTSSSSKGTSSDGNKKASAKIGSNDCSNKQRRSSMDDKKSDKKKKRKRDESPMGPPDKLPLKQDLLNKPVSVSIKSSDGSPVSPSNVLKKFSSSPKSSGSNPIGGSSSNSLLNSKQSPKNSPIYHGSPKHLSSGMHSPKSSPLVTTSLSPKHLSSSGSGKPSMSQLKSATNSPSSKSSSTEKLKSSQSSSHRDRSSSSDTRKSGSSSPKMKQSSVKLKQLDLSLISPIDLITNIGNCDPVNMSSTSPTELNKLNSNRNRKGSLSAVIDKLKSAQNLPDDLPSPGGSSSSSGANSNSNSSSSSSKFQNCSNIGSKDKLCSSSNNQNINKEFKSSSNSGNSVKNLSLSGGSNAGSNLNPNKSSEYMVKPSSDGIKITINKTRTKENNSFKDGKMSSSSGSSKSSSQPSLNKSGSSKSKSGSSSSSLQKSSSSGNLTSSMSSSKSFSSSSKSSGLPKTQSSGSLSAMPLFNSGDLKLKDKLGKSSKVYSSNDRSHHYQGPKDPNDVRKLLGFATCTSPSIDGFIKSFDTKKFQIPKLSARNANTPITSSSSVLNTNISPSLPNNLDLKKDLKHLNSTISSPICNDNQGENGPTAKMLADLLSKEIPQKFPFSVNKIPLEAPHTNMKYNPIAPVPSSNHFSGVLTNDLSAYTKELLDSKKQHGMDYTTATLNESPKLNINNINIGNISSKLMRPPSAPPSQNIQLPKQSPVLDEILDFSAQSTAARTITPPLLQIHQQQQQSLAKDLKLMQPTNLIRKNTTSPFPSSPSVSVHIVKSPVPSPLMVIQSPHSSNSPCITDDELMDEALVGISGK